MADKPRGLLANINWSQANNATSINVKKSAAREPNNNRPQQRKPSTTTSHTTRYSDGDSSSDDEGEPSIQLEYERSRKQQSSQRQQQKATPKVDVPIADIPFNPYPSVVAPVKTGKQEAPKSRQPSANQSTYTNHESQRGGSQEKERDENLMFLSGFLGSMKISMHMEQGLNTGIGAIQIPMSQLYFPYRQNRLPAEERVLNLEPKGLEVRYMENAEDDEHSSFLINWKDILYVEPLKFTTMRQKGKVLSAFEPCESHRNAILGNKMKLFRPMTKEFKHISLMEHPALLTMVVRDPYGRHDQLYSHGYVASTVEEAVYMARRMRQYIEEAFIASQGQPEPDKQGSVSSLNGHTNTGYQQSSSLSMNSYMSTNSTKSKLMAKKQKKSRNRNSAISQHTGSHPAEMDLGSFHFGMSMLTKENDSEDEEIADAVRTNFHIGPKLRTENRQQSNLSGRFSGSMLGENPPESISSFSSRGQPVGVVQPQRTNLRDAYKVLPTQPGDKSKLRPTSRHESSSEVTPDIDLAMRYKQTADDSLMQPRTVVNPLAESEPGAPSRGFVSTTKMGRAAAMSSLPFQTGNALPQSAWHESVIGNFQKKEKIDKRNFSQSVDLKALPKLGNQKKEKEMASLFENTDVSAAAQPSEGGTISGLHEAMGFLP